MKRSRRRAGFTFFEVALVSAIFAALIASFGQAFSASSGVMRESRAALRATEDLRRNLDSIANCFRGASAGSLSGFAADSTSTAPTFRCVTGVDSSGACVLDLPQTLQWATKQEPGGATGGGQVVLVRNGVPTPVARRVPAGGFKATLEGNTLRVSLTTTYKTSQGKTVSVAGDVAVSLRN